MSFPATLRSAGLEDLFAPGQHALVAGWLTQYAASTADAYASDLGGFVRWAVPRGLTLASTSAGDVGEWARALEASGARPATVARKLAALSSFYRWAVGEEAVTRSPLDRVRRPRVAEDSQALGVDADGAARLLAAARAVGPRDHALVCLLLLNGLRVSEACEATIDDLGQARCHVTLRVRRKGGREATVPLAPATADAVAAARAGRGTGPLLLDWAGAPLDRHDAARIVRRLCKRAGLDPLSPHALRPRFCHRGPPAKRVGQADQPLRRSLRLRSPGEGN